MQDVSLKCLNMRDMAQLANRVRHVERLRAEKAKTLKYHQKEKVANVESNESDQEFDIAIIIIWYITPHVAPFSGIWFIKVSLKAG